MVDFEVEQVVEGEMGTDPGELEDRVVLVVTNIFSPEYSFKRACHLLQAVLRYDSTCSAMSGGSNVVLGIT